MKKKSLILMLTCLFTLTLTGCQTPKEKMETIKDERFQEQLNKSIVNQKEVSLYQNNFSFEISIMKPFSSDSMTDNTDTGLLNNSYLKLVSGENQKYYNYMDWNNNVYEVLIEKAGNEYFTYLTKITNDGKDVVREMKKYDELEFLVSDEKIDYDKFVNQALYFTTFENNAVKQNLEKAKNDKSLIKIEKTNTLLGSKANILESNPEDNKISSLFVEYQKGHLVEIKKYSLKNEEPFSINANLDYTKPDYISIDKNLFPLVKA